jgi:hypothetical protein
MDVSGALSGLVSSAAPPQPPSGPWNWLSPVPIEGADPGQSGQMADGDGPSHGVQADDGPGADRRLLSADQIGFGPSATPSFGLIRAHSASFRALSALDKNRASGAMLSGGFRGTGSSVQREAA